MHTNDSTSGPPSVPDNGVVRLRAEVRGTVQGVGFRPFVYRLATDLGLKGWVRNAPQGALLEAEGPAQALAEFLRRLHDEQPPLCVIRHLSPSYAGPAGYTAFEVLASATAGERTACILPDVATCSDCLRELLDPADQRHRYPFINCTSCGPRFSIIESLPYDRDRTTMKRFALCPRCRAEYENPANRRFHAQPNACPECGPHLELWGPTGDVQAVRTDALSAAAAAIRAGAVLAVKGLGGFHLVIDARDPAAVARLRQRKAREEKPFALMLPDVTAVRALCAVSAEEERLLRGPEAPIVLLRRRASAHAVADGVAPGNPCLGCMLAYTPLHHLLLAELGFPVVATSGNLSDEPICTDEREALARLSGIADLFLVHDRPIARPVEDSVARIVLDRPLLLRRARGYAPLSLPIEEPLLPVLATGAHLKNTVAVAAGAQVCVGAHIGDLETGPAFDAFRRAAADLPRLHAVEPVAVACDAHPDYLSTQLAEQMGLPVVRVQHHHAHVLACAAENGLTGPVLGVVWDGTGYGSDGTVWGGEFLRAEGAGFERVAHFRPFRLPGGDRAIREPRRTALGLLHAVLGADLFARADLAPLRAFTAEERRLLPGVLARGVNAPWTSSAGRLFDAVASLLDLRQVVRYEGQAAMELEFAADGDGDTAAYPFALDAAGVIDWGPMVHALLRDREAGSACGRSAARFHNMLVDVVAAVARRAGAGDVVLTGGCFQNAHLLERVVGRLRDEGFRPFWHQHVPPNDGGIALGQVVAASRLLARG